MCRAGHLVELMQIVRLHTQRKQTLGQRAQGVNTVVDSAQQDGLVVQAYSMPGQGMAGLGHICGQFLGMVGVDHHDQRPGQGVDPVQELGIDTGRQYHWQA